MGEAKLKRKLLDRLKVEQVHCVYCGGVAPGTTVDHMPPRTMFARKHRPKGLEFLACEACNTGSRPDEQVASLLSRAFAAPGTNAEREEVREILRAVANRRPRWRSRPRC